MFINKWIVLLSVFIYSTHAQYDQFDSTASTPSSAVTTISSTAASSDEPPEGYYAFVESPNAEPPRVRPPPYSHTAADCREDDDRTPHMSPFNLCGDLNKGTIPRNPMGQNVMGSPYPFELIKNMTLKYLSRTLPILKADDTLPKVAQLQDDLISQNTISHTYNNNDRVKRSISPQPQATPKLPLDVANLNSNEVPKGAVSADDTNSGRETSTRRQSRKFCDQGGVFCMLYKAINGEAKPSAPPKRWLELSPVGNSAQLQVERRDDTPAPGPAQSRYEGPPTPCPAKVEYATPVFAKNYQGVWRYVVQIPYEGYFTQTLEVTRCMQSRCHYLDGGCLSSPRWHSLLVAEIYYPDTVLAAGADTQPPDSPPRSPVHASQPPSVQDFQNYQQYLHKRAGVQAEPANASGSSSSTSKPTHCDGVDALGCFQVRLYYDWFLVPGSCKCWRPDYFNKYVRRKTSSPDL